MLNLKTTLASLAAMLTLSGCMTAPHKAYTANQAKTAPVRNLTNMDLALSCLDGLLVEYQVQPMYITSPGLPNRAGGKVDLSSGADILKTSIGQLSQSNVFRYVDLSLLSMSQYGGNANETGSRPIDANAIDTWIQFLNKYSNTSGFHYPGYLISGSISQLDNSVLSDQAGGSLGSEQIGTLGLNQDQIVSVVTVDMQVVGANYLQVMNGLTTKNSLALAKNGVGADLSGRVKTVGGYFNVSYDRSEGLHQGIRDLIQLGAVELLGKLAKVPYQRCLQGEGAAPGALQADEGRFEEMSAEQRVRFAQQRLAALADPSNFSHAAYYPGPANGVLDAATRDAIARYRRQAGLIANAEIDLDLYRSLTHAQPDKPPSQTAPKLSFASPDGRPLGTAARFRLGSLLRIGLDADRRAHAQCFLRNQNQEVYRIFPSADQPDDTISPGSPALIPAPNNPVQITLDTSGGEEIGCISAQSPLRAGAALPLQALGTAPLPGARSLQAVFEQYQQAQGGEAVGMEVLQFSGE
jgi:hypothetical protein